LALLTTGGDELLSEGEAFGLHGGTGERLNIFLESGHVKIPGEGEEVLEVAGEQFGITVGIEGDFEDGEQFVQMGGGILEVDGFHDGEDGVGKDPLAEPVEGQVGEVDEVEHEVGEPGRVRKARGQGKEIGKAGRMTPGPAVLVEDNGIDRGELTGVGVFLEKGVPDPDHVTQEPEGHPEIWLGLVFEEEMQKEGRLRGVLPVHREEQVAESAGVENGLIDRSRVFEAGPTATGRQIRGKVGLEKGAGDLEVGKSLVMESVP
jgi:hypothetical protein